jgi:hypothetical protein
MKATDAEEDPPNRVNVAIETIREKSVVVFVTKNSKLLFSKVKLPSGFLSLGQRTKIFVALQGKLERDVALIQKCSGTVTKNEEQLQFLLQVVADHRKRLPKALKRSLQSQEAK